MPNSPKLGRLPSLDLMRGFVAVGRRLNITLAAEDLSLTQSAVSKQIQALEQRLGVALFVRGHRSIRFTEQGEALFLAADEALRQIEDAILSLPRAGEARAVTLTTSIGVAGLWLLPRLGDFVARHPNIDVRLSANDKLVHLAAEGIDLAIRYAASAPAGSPRLFGDRMAPVAHPGLGLPPVLSAGDIASHVLLEFDGNPHPWMHWYEWLASQGWQEVKPRSLLQFNQYSQVIQAALAGQGIALGRLDLIGDALRDGKLVQLALPWPMPVSPYSHWLIASAANPRFEVVELMRWIRAEAQVL
jgi:DNA-binding transcriptional LysR family regulator